MAEIFRSRTIRPNTRLESSTNYRVEVSNVNVKDVLVVNIYHENIKEFKRTYYFSGADLKDRDSINFKVEDESGKLIIKWISVEPVNSLTFNTIEKDAARKKSVVLNKQERLFRLTYNKNGWIRPSGHKWEKSSQGNSDIAFENQYGFGGEEWLFNPNFILDGYQYGYIRGVEGLEEGISYLSKARLFTIDKLSKERYLVAIIKKLEIITGFKEKSDAKFLINKYYEEMRGDLRAIEADISGFGRDGFLSNVRFLIQDAEIFAEPISIPGLKGNKYNRFQPYIIDSDLKKILEGVLPDDSFVFNSGIAKNSKSFNRATEKSTNTIERIHGDISDALVDYLHPDYTVKSGNISVEKTKFGSNIADVVVRGKQNELTIFEIKTGSSIRKNLRDGLGQLLDYAFWYDSVLVKCLVIISPLSLEAKELALFNRIKRSLNIKIVYWQYLKNSEGESKFIELDNANGKNMS